MQTLGRPAQNNFVEVDFYAEPYMIAMPPAGVLKLTEMKE